MAPDEMTSPEPKTPTPPAAFMRAVSDLQGRLRGYIVSLVLDRAAADDLLQQTNIVLCEKADEFEPGTNFKAWAFRVASLEVLKHRRNLGRDRWVFDETLLEHLEAAADHEDGQYEARRKRLRSCLQRLRESQRGLILERYFRGRSVQQIAADRNRTANAISQLLFRAKQNLADCVANLDTAEHGGRTNRPRAR